MAATVMIANHALFLRTLPGCILKDTGHLVASAAASGTEALQNPGE